MIQFVWLLTVVAGGIIGWTIRSIRSDRTERALMLMVQELRLKEVIR